MTLTSSTMTSPTTTQSKTLYIGIILIGILIVLSGLAIWNTGAVARTRNAVLRFPTARLVHFFCIAAIVLFLIVHVTLALIVPR